MIGIKQHTNSVKKLHIFMAIVLVLSMITSLIVVKNANAAQALQTMVRFDRVKTSTATTGTVCLKTTASGLAEATVKVTFPTGYTLGAFGTFTVSTATTTGWPASSNAWPSITAPTGAGDIVGQTVKFGSGALGDSTLYCFNWTSTTAVTTASGASSANTGNVETYTSAPALIDHGDYSAPTIANDQIVVNATVPPAFSFALSGNTDNLPTLDSAAVKTSGTPITATVNTNAANGWQVWAGSTLTNGGLHSNNATHTIPSNCSSGVGSNSTLTTAAEGYNTGVDLTIGTGSGSVASIFDRAATNFKGGGLCSTLQTLATGTNPASSAVLTLHNNAAIVGTTPPATDYTDTITLTGAGLF